MFGGIDVFDGSLLLKAALLIKGTISALLPKRSAAFRGFREELEMARNLVLLGQLWSRK
jgi:hypothetical protein